jgi:hypothetical protein
MNREATAKPEGQKGPGPGPNGAQRLDPDPRGPPGARNQT